MAFQLCLMLKTISIEPQETLGRKRLQRCTATIGRVLCDPLTIMLPVLRQELFYAHNKQHSFLISAINFREPASQAIQSIVFLHSRFCMSRCIFIPSVLDPWKMDQTVRGILPYVLRDSCRALNTRGAQRVLFNSGSGQRISSSMLDLSHHAASMHS